MEFRTAFDPALFPFQLTYSDHVLSIGSCFAEHFSTWLNHWGFKHLSNPFGIVFNPLSIATQLEFLSGNRQWKAADVFYNGNYYSTYYAHSSCYSLSAGEALDNLNRMTDLIAFQQSTVVMITLGTAWVYENKQGAEVVANCHKMPSTQFTKRLLSIDEIDKALNKIRNSLKNKKLIFTLSPVRHLKDGFVENNRGKARLLEGIHRCCEKHADTIYFPSYELMVDDLRDYRFYADDLLHPSASAIAYIKEKFVQVAFAEDTRKIIKEAEEIRLLMNHRVLQKDSPAESAFITKREERVKTFTEKYPFVSLFEINK